MKFSRLTPSRGVCLVQMLFWTAQLLMCKKNSGRSMCVLYISVVDLQVIIIMIVVSEKDNKGMDGQKVTVWLKEMRGRKLSDGGMKEVN